MSLPIHHFLHISFPDADSKNMLFYFQSFYYFAKVDIFAHTKNNVKPQKI
jgi:hypothetical protein